MTSVLFRVRPWLVRSVLVCVGLWLTFLSVAAAERPHFDSKGPDKAITVDGKFDDWYGHLQPFGADPVAIQFLNDGEFLYVRLTASDAAARMQISAAGDDRLVRSRRRDEEEVRRQLSGRRTRRTRMVGGEAGWLRGFGGGGGCGGRGRRGERSASEETGRAHGTRRHPRPRQRRRAQPDARPPVGPRRRDPHRGGDASRLS